MDAEIDANASAASDNNPLLSWWIDFLYVVGPTNVVCHTIVPLLIDVNALSLWLARRKMSYEDGFCVRTNTLVDGCYSFWQAGAAPCWMAGSRPMLRARGAEILHQLQ
jgi:hypothetical protein